MEITGQIRVAAVYMTDVVYLCDALCLQRGDHQCGAAPQIGGLNGGAVERRDAPYDGHPSLRADVRAHPQQLRHVAVAAVEHILHKHGGALAAQQRRHQQRLRVSGKAGVGGGAHRGNGAQLSVALQCDALRAALQAAARLMQRRGDSGQMAVIHALQRDAAACGGCRTEVCSGGNAVTDTAVGAAVIHALSLYGDGGGAGAVDLHTQLLQKVLQIHDLRLAGGIGDDRGACGAAGATVISNAAREPEIVDLQDFLQKLGVEIHGAGSSTVTVKGQGVYHGCTHRCIGDRIAAATYLCAAAAAGGCVTLEGVDYRHLATVTTALHQAGCRLQCRPESITLESDGQLRAVSPVRTSPYPGFPTDAQALLMAALLRSEGATMFVENMFDSRYRHVPELLRMGADIRPEGRVAVVWGVPALHGAAVQATDLRGGAALVIAALQAEGVTQVYNICHIHRGYADLAGDLHSLGARIRTEAD